MKSRYLLIIFIPLISIFFFGCKKDFSVSEKIDISTTKETIDDNYNNLNKLVQKINEQHLLQVVQQRFPNSAKPVIHVGISKTRIAFELLGKADETYSLAVNFSMNYDETKAGEAAAILSLYKELYREELKKYNVPI